MEGERIAQADLDRYLKARDEARNSRAAAMMATQIAQAKEETYAALEELLTARYRLGPGDTFAPTGEIKRAPAPPAAPAVAPGENTTRGETPPGDAS
jgi:hypothetical protein